MQQKLPDPRIQSMFAGDRLWAYGLIVALWALYAFVLFTMMPNLKEANILRALSVAGGMVLLFNTASIMAMISHYSHDKEHIYGLDLHYLDIMKAGKA